MTSWIFQGNPDTFDLDGYLQSTPGAITWLAKRGTSSIATGDTVYLWRSAGKVKKGKPSGVIAFGEVISTPSPMFAEPASKKYWTDQTNLGEEQPRVWLKILRVANGKEELKREWLLDDAVLKDMLIMKQPAGTNFRLSEAEGVRLRKMWTRVGQRWTRNEALAGLWAYSETFGKEVSRLPGSPVEKVSSFTGRASSGVYNKVMNFRSIDPRDDRDGMSGASDADRAVWAEFFDPVVNQLDVIGLNREFNRIWSDVVSAGNSLSDVRAEGDSFDSAVEKLEDKTLEELLQAYNRQQFPASKLDQGRPRAVSTRSTVFDRNPLVVQIARLRASYACEVPACKHEPFADQFGRNYCEVHHIVPLALGGKDLIENVACVCPAHHREAHFGKNAEKLAMALDLVRTQAQ